MSEFWTGSEDMMSRKVVRERTVLERLIDEMAAENLISPDEKAELLRLLRKEEKL